MFRLRFDEAELKHWANRYTIEEDSEVEKIGVNTRKRGYYIMPEFQTLCAWKTPRSKPLIASNDPVSVEITTRAALSTGNENFRIEQLMTLKGVSWPTASVLLHFGLDNRFPILDIRALWSLGHDRLPPYTFDFWLAYTEFCRELSVQNKMDMRTVDRALWAYSKFNQGRLSTS